MNKALILMVAGSSAVAGLANRSLGASPVIDGTLDSAYGAPLAVQTQVTDSPSEANTATPTGSPIALRNQILTYSQLSAAYGIVDTTNNVLDLFFAGSLNLGADTSSTGLALAIQTNATGVQSLAGQPLPIPNGGTTAPLDNVTFDPGFKPNALFTFQYNGGIASDYYNLTTATHVAADLDPSSGSTASQSQIMPVTDSFNASHTYGYDDPSGQLANGEGSGNPTTDGAGVRTRTDPGAPTYSIVTNNALDQVHVGSGSAATTLHNGTDPVPADPGYTGATTGTELQIALTEDPTDLQALYYTGGPIEVSAFITDQSFTYITNQVLGADTGAGDISLNGDQFLNTTEYGGNQYFSVPGVAVPEPASLGLLAVGGIALVRRRRAL